MNERDGLIPTQPFVVVARAVSTTSSVACPERGAARESGTHGAPLAVSVMMFQRRNPREQGRMVVSATMVRVDSPTARHVARCSGFLDLRSHDVTRVVRSRLR